MDSPRDDANVDEEVRLTDSNREEASAAAEEAAAAEQQRAATKIQALERGRQERKQLAANNARLDAAREAQLVEERAAEEAAPAAEEAATQLPASLQESRAEAEGLARDRRFQVLESSANPVQSGDLTMFIQSSLEDKTSSQVLSPGDVIGVDGKPLLVFVCPVTKTDSTSRGQRFCGRQFFNGAWVLRTFYADGNHQKVNGRSVVKVWEVLGSSSDKGFKDRWSCDSASIPGLQAEYLAASSESSWKFGGSSSAREPKNSPDATQGLRRGSRKRTSVSALALTLPAVPTKVAKRGLNSPGAELLVKKKLRAAVTAAKRKEQAAGSEAKKAAAAAIREAKREAKKAEHLKKKLDATQRQSDNDRRESEARQTGMQARLKALEMQSKTVEPQPDSAPAINAGHIELFRAVTQTLLPFFQRGQPATEPAPATSQAEVEYNAIIRKYTALEGLAYQDFRGSPLSEILDAAQLKFGDKKALERLHRS